MSELAVALTGNPNTGKSTIFNALTGARQKIGNWPGVTVDKKIGHTHYKGRAISIVDLPGTYSINARSPEEQIVIDYLTSTKLDLVLDVVDSSNIERNLFLTVQLLEKGIPLLIDLNMQDDAQRRGIKINTAKLEEALGMPTVETTGRSSKSTKTLLDVFTSTVMARYQPSDLVKAHIAKIHEIESSSRTEAEKQEAIIEARYALIDQVVQYAVTVQNVGATRSEKMDRFLANGALALPIFLLILYGVFQITFTWIGQPIADELEVLINDQFLNFVKDSLVAAGVADWMVSLVTDGIIAGVGSVLTFVPLIFVLFFCLSFLDGTGYMARIAFITDPIMRRCGLTGKGIMPLMMGFGCAVPSIMGARALDSEKDRMISILVTPFLTCGAKLPIMALFAAMFFPNNAANVVFLMYIIGMVMAIIVAKVLGSTLFKAHGSTFLLELPPYRMPDMNSVLLETWDKGKGYLIKAGTIIFARLRTVSSRRSAAGCLCSSHSKALQRGRLVRLSFPASWRRKRSLRQSAFSMVLPMSRPRRRMRLIRLPRCFRQVWAQRLQVFLRLPSWYSHNSTRRVSRHSVRLGKRQARGNGSASLPSICSRLLGLFRFLSIRLVGYSASDGRL